MCTSELKCTALTSNEFDKDPFDLKAGTGIPGQRICFGLFFIFRGDVFTCTMQSLQQ